MFRGYIYGKCHSIQDIKYKKIFKVFAQIPLSKVGPAYSKSIFTANYYTRYIETCQQHQMNFFNKRTTFSCETDFCSSYFS